ncbi:Uncharacterised protein [Mycobacteroides abscessus subsp. abscessus]|nr:Uncharacterised protein [Mycobacteroides abscessus subsp. abscessus]
MRRIAYQEYTSLAVLTCRARAQHPCSDRAHIDFQLGSAYRQPDQFATTFRCVVTDSFARWVESRMKCPPVTAQTDEYSRAPGVEDPEQ